MRVSEFYLYDANRSGFPRDVSQLETISQALAVSTPMAIRLPTLSYAVEENFDLQDMLDEHSLPVHGPSRLLQHQTTLSHI